MKDVKYVTVKHYFSFDFFFQKIMDILYKLFQEHQMMLLSSTTTTTPLPLPYGSDVQCGRSWKNDTLGKVWYFVTKIVLTYCEKKLFY